MIDEKIKNITKSFEKVHASFIKNSIGLEVFLNKIIPVVTKHDKAINNQLEKATKEILKIGKQAEKEFISNIINIYKSLPDKIRKKITIKELKEYAKEYAKKEPSIGIKKTGEQIKNIISNSIITPTLHTELLFNSSFIMLISYFDYLFVDLVRIYYKKYPEILYEDNSIKLKDLVLSKNIEEAISFIINNKVDELLYKSFEDKKYFLENYLKLDIQNKIINWDVLIEAIERRNIIVHNNSKINHRYAMKIGNLSNLSFNIIIKEGEKITINTKYFNIIFNEILLAGIIIFQCCFRKWNKNDKNSIDKSLLEDLSFLIRARKWNYSERLGIFSKLYKVKNKQNSIDLNILYCHALKNLNKLTELEMEIKEIDKLETALSPYNILKISVLKNDKNTFFKNLKNTIIVNGIKKNDILNSIYFEDFIKEWKMEKELEKFFNNNVNDS